MSETTKQRAVSVLLRLGVSMRTRGWEYLLAVVTLAAESPEPPDTAALYRNAADAAGVSVQTVKNGCAGPVKSALSRGLPVLPPAMSAEAFIAHAAALVRQGIKRCR